MKKIFLPLSIQEVAKLKAGDCLLLCGSMLVARDEAHLFLQRLRNSGAELPCSLKGETIFYMGPATDKKGNITAAGPTTSARMDAFTPFTLQQGAVAFVGKGKRSEGVALELKKHGAVYFAAVGGAGAVYADSIKYSEIIAFPELGAEALRRITVQDFPVIVAQDSFGNSVY